jgi:DNA polymerase (family 10)
MAEHSGNDPTPLLSRVLSNAEIADRLASLAQLLYSQKENRYKVKAYQRAAGRIRNLSESLDEMVRDQDDLTRFAGIGEAIASAIREIVTTGKLEKLRTQVTLAIASIISHPRLDPKRVVRVYKTMGARWPLPDADVAHALTLDEPNHRGALISI